MNKLIITGRICRDPEVKAIGDNNMVAKFTIAVNRNYKDKETGERPADFIPCEAFGKTAEFVSNYITKGRLVEVEGEYRVDQYQNEEGENRSFTKCHVNSLNALDSVKDQENKPDASIEKTSGINKPGVKGGVTKPGAKGKGGISKPGKPAMAK